MPVDADYEFGKTAVRRNVLRQEHLEECVELLVALERAGSSQRIWDIIGRKGYMRMAEIQRLRGELESHVAPGDETTELPLQQIDRARSYSLAHLTGTGQFHLFPVPQRLITLGRDEACDIVLAEKDVAAQQVQIRFSGQQHIIEDAGFGSNVLVNHRPLVRQNLGQNDLIELGSSLLLFLLSDDSNIAEPAAKSLIPENPVARITITDGPKTSASFFLGAQPIVFGSSALASARIPDKLVASLHAHLSQTPEGIMLTDLKSGALPRVNGIPTARRIVNDGDNISIGATTFSVREIHGNKLPVVAPESKEPTAANVEDVPEYNVPDEPEIEPASDPMLRRAVEFPRAEPAVISQPRVFKPGRLQLNCVDGNLAGQRFVLKKNSTIIGRDSSADICIEDGSVSRRHVEILLGDKPPELRDLKSRNGVQVNGKRVQRAILRPGDAIRIDKCLFIAEEVVRRKKA